MINYTLKQIAEITNGELIGDGSVVCKGVQYDSRLMQPNQLFAPFKGEKLDGHTFVKGLFEKGIQASLWAKDCPLEKPQGNLVVVEDVLKALQQIAQHYRESLTTIFIGVTGSSGKTSTKDIIAAVLSVKYRTYKTKGNFNNKLGVPLTLINMDDDVEVAVIEMGIDDFGIMEMLVRMVQPNFTVITSIAPAHIQQFQTMENIIQQKCWINSRLKPDGICFYSQQCDRVKEQLLQMGLQPYQMMSYGFDETSDICAFECDLKHLPTSFRLQDQPERTWVLPLLGKHQVLNALAAIGIGRHFGLTLDEIQEGFNQVVLTPHRLQLLNLNQALVIDDSYNANPASMSASLQAVEDYHQDYMKTVVIGDMLELGKDSYKMHYDLAQAVDFQQFDHIYLVGEQVKGLYQALKEKNIDATIVQSGEELIETLKGYLHLGNLLFFKASNGMGFARLIERLKEEQ